MRPHVKICGITNKDDAMRCVDLGADALGFIFYKKSPRYIEQSKASKIISVLPSYVTPVGVFVNERHESIERSIQETAVRIIQLSGDEKPSDCEDFTVKVWKSFRFISMNEVNSVRRYHIAAAMLDGSSGALYGGSGMTADVSIASAMKQYFPLVLAGGLNPDNIVDSIRAVQPHVVDVNSGIESSPGKKDHHKLQLLFTQIAELE